MEAEYFKVILSLVGFIQAIFMFIVGYLFKVNGTIFAKLDSNKKEASDKIEENSKQDKQDKADLEKKMTDLLNDHYVTNGQLTTLEATLMGKIEGLTIAITTLTTVIEKKL